MKMYLYKERKTLTIVVKLFPGLSLLSSGPFCIFEVLYVICGNQILTVVQVNLGAESKRVDRSWLGCNNVQFSSLIGTYFNNTVVSIRH